MELRRQALFDLTMDAALRRTVSREIEINTIIDVGASNGSWTKMARRYLPNARALLIEANVYHQEALERFCANDARVEYVLAAAGDITGEIFFDAGDPFGGLASHQEQRGYTRVPATTIDFEVTQRSLEPPFLLKLDTHGFEVPVLQGATGVLNRTHLIVIETYNFQLTPDSLRFPEMCAYLAARDFRPIDLCDILHRPLDGALWQFDLIFLRADRHEFQHHRYQ